jgi:predicted secreted Zn-dependent protease
MQISLDRVHDFIDDLADQYQREEEQAIMQRNMDKAVLALAGKEACERLRSTIGMRSEMDANAVRVLRERKRA